jgi:heat shock protein HslJ
VVDDKPDDRCADDLFAAAGSAEERHSTRGRAHLLFEMLRGETITDGWESDEVKHALDLCLACKACKSECPVSVDMATYKAEFLAHYYARRSHPIRAHLFGHIDWWAALAARMPRLVNAFASLRPIARSLQAAAGVAPQRRLPRFAPETFQRWMARHPPRSTHLVFQAGRLSGSDGCNRITGNYQLKGDAVTFGQMAGTRMACIDAPAEVERAFRDSLRSATRLTSAGDRLELFDATGNRVGAFTGSAQASAPANSPPLAGTSWQLVKFQGSDGTTLTPDDRTKYTIEFGAEGRLTVRVDCNRGRGTWKSSGSGQLQFGPLALTRAKCPPESLHDHIVKQWSYVRSYVTKDGHLFLSLMADGGIYEFEPVTKPSLHKAALVARIPLDQ